jgi:superfamily II DNA/RNA helicase
LSARDLLRIYPEIHRRARRGRRARRREVAKISGDAARKALIFTDSRRPQEYLKTFLESHGYRGQVVLFNGTNGGPEAHAIYERWVDKNRDTGRSSGSRAVDVRTALIEHFRDEGSILLATEAASSAPPTRCLAPSNPA